MAIKQNPVPHADPHHLARLSENGDGAIFWTYSTPYSLETILEPGFFRGIGRHGLQRLDQIEVATEIDSDTPELAPPRRGCPFKRRCPHHLGEICNREAPPWQSPAGSQGHKIRCHIPIDALAASQRAVIAP